MLEVVKDSEIDTPNFVVINGLYYHQNVKVRIEGQTSNSVRICRRVRQGRVLSLMLFMLYCEIILEKGFEKMVMNMANFVEMQICSL